MPQPGGVHDELKEIATKRTWIAGTSLLAMGVLAIAILRAPPSGGVVVAAIVLISVKKALVRYHALGKRRTALQDGSGAEEA